MGNVSEAARLQLTLTITTYTTATTIMLTAEPGTVAIRFTLDPEFPVEEYLLEGIIDCAFPQDDGSYQVIIKDVDETLIETLRTDEIAEFLGIESEFVTYCEVLN